MEVFLFFATEFKFSFKLNLVIKKKSPAFRHFFFHNTWVGLYCWCDEEIMKKQNSVC